MSAFFGAIPGAMAQGLIYGILALGVYLSFRVLDIADLTVDGALATGGAVSVMLIRMGFSPWLSLLCALLAGALAGLATGILHTGLHIPAILSGILTQLSLYSVNLRILGAKANQPVSVDRYRLPVSQRFVGMLSFKNPLFPLLGLAAVFIILLYWFFGTERGCAVRATGSNPAMARAEGIDTGGSIRLGLALSNGLVALSGALLASYQGAADVNMGRGAIVIGLAAIIIGETLFGSRSHGFLRQLLSVCAGSVLYYLLLTVILQMGLHTNDLKLISALLVTVFLSLPKKGGVRHA